MPQCLDPGRIGMLHLLVNEMVNGMENYDMYPVQQQIM